MDHQKLKQGEEGPCYEVKRTYFNFIYLLEAKGPVTQVQEEGLKKNSRREENHRGSISFSWIFHSVIND